VALRPAIDDDPTHSIDDIYLALTNLNMGQVNSKGDVSSSAYTNLGFDMDGVCSGQCLTETRSPCKPVSPDGNYCRDNKLGDFANVLEFASTGNNTWVKLNNHSLNCTICTGGFNYVLKISGYDGTLNDSSVRIDMYSSTGSESQATYNCEDANLPMPTTCWTKANDKFDLTDASFASGQGISTKGGVPSAGAAKLFNSSAFVRDGYLIAMMPQDAELWLSGKNAVATIPMILRYSRIAGKLAKANGAWQLTDTVWGGRMRGDDVLAGLPAAGVCNSQGVGMVKTTMSSYLDLPDTEQLDPNVTCSSMSVGLTTQWKEASIGIVVPALVKPTCD
jgi:hypothetical protein